MNQMIKKRPPLRRASELYDAHEIPRVFTRHYILSGYRKPCTTFRACLKSVFQLHNESVNIWSHSVSFMIFTAYLCTELRTFEFEAFTVPYFLLIYGAMACTLTSTIAHIFSIFDEYVDHVCFMADYAGISQHSLITATAIRAYGWPRILESTWIGRWFSVITCFSGVYSTYFACQTRFIKFKHHPLLFQMIRLTSFAVPFIIDHIPLLYRSMVCEIGENDCDPETMQMYMIMLFLFFVAAVLYGSHIPERLYPKKFDIFGHSHSMFHLAISAATFTQLCVLRLDMISRETFVRTSWSIAEHAYIFIPLVLNPFIVAGFGWYCYHYKIERTMSNCPTSNGVSENKFHGKKKK